MNYLVDTNVLVQLASEKGARHALVRATVKRLRRQRHVLHVTPQNLIEFWNVATRPLERNGIGMNPTAAARVLRMFERFFKLLPDTPQIYPEWRSLIMEYKILGVQVYDARLTAVMRAHGITHILTFNVKDFARYRREGIVVVEPSTVRS